MDVWIVAAAAGAGYVAQRLKNITRGKQNLSDLSYKNLNTVGPESSGTIQNVQESFGEEMCRQRERVCVDASTAEMVSTSGFEGENLVMFDNIGSWDAVSNSNSLVGVLNKDDIPGDWGGIVPSEGDEVIASDSLPQRLTREIGFSHGLRQSRSRIRSRRINSKFIKPQTSLESCLMAQLYREHVEIEEYTYIVDPPQKPIVRPFLVSDGSRIISTVSHQSCTEPNGTGKNNLWKDVHSQKVETVHGVPRLPDVLPVQLKKKAKTKTQKEQALTRSNVSKTENENQKNAQGSSGRSLLFYLGLTMGIVYSSLEHKPEIEKLRKLLKQTENLVQDLQEELEMKDGLMVKELAAEDYDSVDVHNDSSFDIAMQGVALDQKLDHSSRYRNDEHRDQNADEESLRKIEAELEAELDRLESNMNSSRLESKISNAAEQYADFVSNVMEGELRADLFGAKNSTYANRDESSSSTPRSVHHPVSPRELSLRLHEVIQSRLEERVKELEMALEHSRMKIKSMESERARSSNHESPISVDGVQSIDEPVVINLSGEALAAYNEAYEEFTKLSESDEEENNHQEVSHRHKRDFNLLNESEEGEDEMERLLIRQIVEKARQGSPAILKAQRALLSTGEY